MRLPQVGVSEATLSPTKLRIVSTTIAIPISKVNSTISSGMRFGKIS